ncbi:MAG: hypothetical protein K2N71_09930 [Oscillospiraceae bacterium]|nr:hypothetical protein [Oscillospiraceae bacterium]
MKIDFYELFSLHTPNDFPEAGEDNYITAAVKSRVMENIPASRSKPVRIRKIGKAFLAAAAAVVVLAIGTLAASALGLIDLERIFGGVFKSGTEHLAGITAVPQDVVITGDDRLSFRVLGIGGTENEAFGAIEIKRNDGGVFPEHMRIESYGRLNTAKSEFVLPHDEFDVIDETTAILYFRHEAIPEDENFSLINTSFTYTVSRIIDNAEIAKLQEKYGVYVDNEEDAAYLQYLRENEDVVLEGEWTITFPLDYSIEKRTVSVNEPFRNVDCGIYSSLITDVEYSAITLDILLDDVVNYGLPITFDDENPVIVKLDSGEEFTVSYSYSTSTLIDNDDDEEIDEEFSVVHFSFEKPIDIDSVETITIGDIVIPVK